ncbi:MAG: hypothetical protein PHS41_04285, partial [Victivallaceae bacterium]|nr:hypothetical protein [Victivallaceae bacterium]
ISKRREGKYLARAYVVIETEKMASAMIRANPRKKIEGRDEAETRQKVTGHICATLLDYRQIWNFSEYRGADDNPTPGVLRIGMTSSLRTKARTYNAYFKRLRDVMLRSGATLSDRKPDLRTDMSISYLANPTDPASRKYWCVPRKQLESLPEFYKKLGLSNPNGNFTLYLKANLDFQDEARKSLFHREILLNQGNPPSISIREGGLDLSLNPSQENNQYEYTSTFKHSISDFKNYEEMAAIDRVIPRVGWSTENRQGK